MMSDKEKTMARIHGYMPYAVLITFMLCVVGVTLGLILNSKVSDISTLTKRNNELLEGRTALFNEITGKEAELAERLGKLEGKVDFILIELQNKADKKQ